MKNIRLFKEKFMFDQINVTRSSMPELSDYVKEISTIWDNHWLTNMGEKHIKLEKALTEYLAVKNVTLFTNGHLALESSLEAFQLSGEVITTPFSFASTTHSIVRNGLKPVFCDVKPSDYTIDANKIEELITNKTTAILPVHVYGNPCDVYEIDRIAKKYNLKVIYDSAHAFGVSVDSVGIGNFGDASMFSFHATKVFNTIEGGAVTYSDETLKNKLNKLKNFGIADAETVDFVGGNGKMNEFQAAMGLCNLKNVEGEIDKRKIISMRYIENLKEVDGIKLPTYSKNVKGNYSYFPVIFNPEIFRREMVYQKLMENNVITRKYFYPLISDYQCYASHYDSSLTPIAKKVAGNVLTLPLYADLALKQVDRICGIIKESRM